MSNTTTNTAPPAPQRHGPDGIEIVFAVVIALLLLPVIVVGAVVAAVLRRQGPRFTAAAAVLGSQAWASSPSRPAPMRPGSTTGPRSGLSWMPSTITPRSLPG